MKTNNQHHPHSSIIGLGLLAIGLGISGCGGQSSLESTATSTDPKGASLRPTLIVDAPPASAIRVAEARKAVQPGAEIVITGFVGGRADPFVEGRAALTLADGSVLETCDRRPGDGCPTPWDACCDPPEKIEASVATIQVVDANGQVLKQGLKDIGGIREQVVLTVKGKVAPSSSPEALIVSAEQIHVGATH